MIDQKGVFKNIYKNLVTPILKKDTGIDAEYLTNFSLSLLTFSSNRRNWPLISRIIKIGNITRSNFGKLYCYSFATAFFIYVVVNMMMVLGLLPIVGSPLPIMSYGGSSMMAMMLGLGIVMSCKIYKDVPVN